MGEKELTTEEWKQQKKEQRAIFTARQRLPYDIKLKRQARRAWQFYEELLNRDMNCHVSVQMVRTLFLTEGDVTMFI